MHDLTRCMNACIGPTSARGFYRRGSNFGQPSLKCLLNCWNIGFGLRLPTVKSSTMVLHPQCHPRIGREGHIREQH